MFLLGSFASTRLRTVGIHSESAHLDQGSVSPPQVRALRNLERPSANFVVQRTFRETSLSCRDVAPMMAGPVHLLP